MKTWIFVLVMGLPDDPIRPLVCTRYVCVSNIFFKQLSYDNAT
jgi:hypothetical protein